MTDLMEKKPNTLGSRLIRIITGSIVGLIVLLGGFVGLAYIDPFGWHLLDRFGGEYDAALAAMPPNTIGYLGINLLEAKSDRSKEIFSTFNEAIKEASGEDVQTETHDMFLEEFGIKMEDITPWVGQYVGIGLIDLTFDDQAEPESIDLVIAIESLDNVAADAFLVKLQDAITQKQDMAATTETYQDLTLTVFSSGDPGEQIAFTRSGQLVLIATNPTTLKQAIDTQNGESLANSADYTAVTKALPANRTVTLYVNGPKMLEIFQKMSDQLQMMGADQSMTYAQGLNHMGFSVVFNEHGIQIDTELTYDLAELSEMQKLTMANPLTNPTTANLFPSDTLVYTGGQLVGGLWSAVEAQMTAQGGVTADDVEESMQFFVEQFGFHPGTDLLDYLNGEMGFAVVPSSDSIIATMGQIDLGFAMVAQTNQEEKLAQTMQTFSTKLSDPQMGVGTVTENNSGNLHLYDVTDPSNQTSIVSFGTGNGYLLLGTSSGLLKSLNFANEGDSLATSSKYQQAAQAFGAEAKPIVYADVTGLLTQIRNSPMFNAEDASEFDEATAVLEPIHTIAAVNSVSETSAHSTFIIFINTK